MNILQLIEMKTLNSGGCTYSLSAAEFILPPSPLYVLSLHKELEEVIPREDFNVTSVRMFIIKNSELLWQPNVAVGSWVFENKVYLDVSTLFDKGQVSLDELKLMSTDQVAAWDMETNEMININ